jgi:hypothetical protein
VINFSVQTSDRQAIGFILETFLARLISFVFCSSFCAYVSFRTRSHVITVICCQLGLICVLFGVIKRQLFVAPFIFSIIITFFLILLLRVCLII